MRSVVYLLHFMEPIGDLDNPHGQAQHYLGYSDNLVDRLRTHKSGNGARIMQVLKERGIGWCLVRLWAGDKKLEKKLKRRKASPRLCPICKVLREKHEGQE